MQGANPCPQLRVFKPSIKFIKGNMRYIVRQMELYELEIELNKGWEIVNIQIVQEQDTQTYLPRVVVVLKSNVIESDIKATGGIDVTDVSKDASYEIKGF